MKKWIFKFFILLILFILIKNIQIILPILFEYKKIVILVLIVIGTIFNVFFNIFICNKYISQIDNYTNKEN